MKKDETFGQLLKKLRKEKKLTLRQLAQKLGIKHSYLSQLETGLANKPSEELARRIANVFGKNEEEIIFIARKVSDEIREIKEKYPKIAPIYFRKILNKKEDEKK